MKIECIGGGPAALYFAVLMKNARPETQITIREQNRSDDTFGWGVVFSKETMGNIEEADPESYAAIESRFAYWDDIDTFYRDSCVTSTGHGFCGLARVEMLEILHARCRELGVELRFEETVVDFEALRSADLVVAADGVNSMVREAWAEHFRPTIEWGKCRFAWLGTTKPLDAFTFIFRENEDGLFMVHAYPFEANRSTFIVECHEDTWRRSGLDKASEEETVRYMDALFADHLEGHRLLTNKSIWRSFPTIKNEHWHHENVVLMGDAVHTAHFSIGSGTKLAMEDAIALVDAFEAYGDDVPAALEAYEASRRIDVLKLQKAARTSQTWFENAQAYLDQDPVTFTFNLMTRSKRITYDNLGARDPELIEQVTEVFAEHHGTPRDAEGVARPPIFTPFTSRGLRLENRLVVSPMCQYSARDGVPNEWHLVHLGGLAVGGAGLLFTEKTNVSAIGRITKGCTGIWSDAQQEAWTRIVDFVHANSATKIGMQLGHAGRKGACHLPWEGDDPLPASEQWPLLAPSAIPFDTGWPVPKAMTRSDMDEVIEQFAAATQRSLAAGFDLVEIHMAHGYLLSSFLSPLSNQREDEYGGSLDRRLRFPLEVLDAVRSTWPEDGSVFVRITASDWRGAEGLQVEDTVQIAKALKAHGCDVVDVSSGGNVPRADIDYGRMYQVPFAERIRREAQVPVMAVGAIQGWDQANTILAAERADLCAMARAHLVDPHLTLRASIAYGNEAQAWPKQYLAAKPLPRR